MLDYDQALARILEAMPVLGRVSTPLSDALGAVAFEDIASLVDLPPFDNSQMDGYACIAADIAVASADSPVSLRIVSDESAAGRAASAALGTGEALPISTGAPAPEGATAIVMVEDTRPSAKPGYVEILESVRDGQFIRKAGEDAARGQVVVPAASLITPGAIAMAAAAGHAEIPIVRRPRVAVIATGDELVPPGAPLGKSQIYESNTPMLAAMVRDAGAECVFHTAAADRVESLREAFDLAAASGADVIVTSGGVSVGGHDLVKDVFAERGTVDFWRVAVRPGKPFAFGQWGDRFFYGLPGNPASSMVTFELFVRPALRLMAGHSRVTRPTLSAILSEPVRHEPGRRSFLRAQIVRRGERLEVRAFGKQASHLITPMVTANSLLIVPEDAAGYDAGDTVRVMVLGDRIAELALW